MAKKTAAAVIDVPPEVTVQGDPGDEHRETPAPTADEFRARSAETFMHLAVGGIVPSPTNPRKHFDEVKLAELADSIRQHGVVQPIVVRALNAERFEVVAGERRFRAVLLAEQPTIPAMIRDLTDVDVLEIQAIENNQRADVLPLEEAHAYRNLIDSGAYGQGEAAYKKLAEKLGRSLSYVYQRLQLLKLVPVAQELVLRGELPGSHATEIARLQPDDQVLAVTFATTGNSHSSASSGDTVEVSFRRLKEFIHGSLLLDLSHARFATKDENLLPQAGSCLSCPKRTGNNAALFPDIQKGDTCADRHCYWAKLGAHVDQLLDKKKQELGKSVAISVDHDDWRWKQHAGPDSKLPLFGHQYRVCEKGSCEHATFAVVIHDSQGGKVGDTGWVCTEAKCKTHAGRFTYEKSESEKEREREDKRKRKIEEAHREGLIQAIAREHPKEITRELLNFLIVGWWSDMHWDNQKLATKVLGLEPPETPDYNGKMSPNCRETASHCVAGLTDEEVIRMAVWMRFVGKMKVQTYYKCEPWEELEKAAADLGINVAASRSVAEDLYKPKAPKVGKPEKPAPKPKKGKKEPPTATPVALKMIEVEGLALADIQTAYADVGVITKDEVTAYLASRSAPQGDEPASEDAELQTPVEDAPGEEEAQED